MGRTVITSALRRECGEPFFYLESVVFEHVFFFFSEPKKEKNFPDLRKRNRKRRKKERKKKRDSEKETKRCQRVSLFLFFLYFF